VKHLVLVGLMGAGKTTVGQMCAARLGRAFVDTDDLVETLAHASVSEIFASDGEARFRELEQQAVAEACASPEPLVIACGGGAVLAPANRRLLRAAGTVVWLRAPPRCSVTGSPTDQGDLCSHREPARTSNGSRGCGRAHTPRRRTQA